MPILTFILETELKIFKETLLLFTKFMSAFWKISYFNRLFEEKKFPNLENWQNVKMVMLTIYFGLNVTLNPNLFLITYLYIKM